MVRYVIALLVSVVLSSYSTGKDSYQESLSVQLVALNPDVLSEEEAATAKDRLIEYARNQQSAADDHEAQALEAVRSLEGWEKHRDPRIEALARSLGTPPVEPLVVKTTSRIDGIGYSVENLVISGRPGLPITANLYLPDPLRENMPAILICPSHHRPKEQGELQDMGMTWARSGAVVLVLDNLGHGERRQQPFGGREDYHWRYNLGIQLHLVGQSLMGWMVADLRKCLDVLLARKDVDAGRVFLIGAVAGGGDPAAVTAALDSRVICSIPFNFGGGSRVPGQPPSYNFVGGGSWESTRTLRLSGRDGFFPWLIVAAAAPRHLIFAREFQLDGAAELAWGRIQGVYKIYDKAERVAEIHGFSHLPFRPPTSSPCTNVGPIHRRQIYPLLEKWFGMPVPEEYPARLEPERLSCLTAGARTQFRVRPLHSVLSEIVKEGLVSSRRSLEPLDMVNRRERLREQWGERLGEVAPISAPRVVRSNTTYAGGLRVEKILLGVEPGIQVPLILLQTEDGENSVAAQKSVVVGIAQQGKHAFLVKRAHEIASLLEEGVAVCLPDVRGTGETELSPERRYSSPITQLSALELKLGQTLLGARLRDLRSVMSFLSSRKSIDESRIGLWGDSLGQTNPEVFVDPPLRTDFPPHHAEPMGAMLALLGALFEDRVHAVVARGGLLSYASILDAAAFYVPHDAIVPGWLEVGDVCDLAAALAPLPVNLEALVDGRNRLVRQKMLDSEFAPARLAYSPTPQYLRLTTQGANLADWLVRYLTDSGTHSE
jgi:cephalosporin-C deacetylase-like acetyl esterase